jgi:hypothetical protein
VSLGEGAPECLGDHLIVELQWIEVDVGQSQIFSDGTGHKLFIDGLIGVIGAHESEAGDQLDLTDSIGHTMSTEQTAHLCSLVQEDMPGLVSTPIQHITLLSRVDIST